ncbi:hypothetical protein, partial [Ornithinicoccus halotolerans]|uniref:hypothetical protein n=1 Tax=Ornithinicoccus halotolerans TaxID=1748220 RepID=UPI001E41EC8E
AAGTVQVVFQMATRLYYEVDGRVPPPGAPQHASRRRPVPCWAGPCCGRWARAGCCSPRSPRWNAR